LPEPAGEPFRVWEKRAAVDGEPFEIEHNFCLAAAFDFPTNEFVDIQIARLVSFACPRRTPSRS
jgi:hypothetical protein